MQSKKGEREKRNCWTTAAVDKRKSIVSCWRTLISPGFERQRKGSSANMLILSEHIRPTLISSFLFYDVDFSSRIFRWLAARLSACRLFDFDVCDLDEKYKNRTKMKMVIVMKRRRSDQ